MKLRSKERRRIKPLETLIFNPEEEHLVNKALYASLQTNKKRLKFDDDRSNDSNNVTKQSSTSPENSGSTTTNNSNVNNKSTNYSAFSPISTLQHGLHPTASPNAKKWLDLSMENIFEKMHFAARKSASVTAAGLKGPFLNAVNLTPSTVKSSKLESSINNLKSKIVLDSSKPECSTTLDQEQKHSDEPQIPSTENFLQFLIFRGTPCMPDNLKIFETLPWEPVNRPKPLKPCAANNGTTKAKEKTTNCSTKKNSEKSQPKKGTTNQQSIAKKLAKKLVKKSSQKSKRSHHKKK